MDLILWLITIMAVILIIMGKVDNRYNENFEVYRPTTYELQPKFPYYNTKLDFNCVNRLSDMDNVYANVCKSKTTCVPSFTEDSRYVLARGLGKPRQLRQLY